MNYGYKARDRYGKAISGSMRADNKDAVAKYLNSVGYVPIEIEENEDLTTGLTRFLDMFKGVRLEDVNMFTRQLLTLQRAGIPLLTSLTILEKQAQNNFFRDILKEVAGRVEEGTSLSDALANYPNIFNDLYVNMIKAGEASGLLDEILERLTEFGEKELDTRAKVKSATRYPLITLGALCVAFLVVVTFVIPKFSSIFAQFKTQLPLPTKILLGLNVVIKRYWYLLLMLIGLIYFLIWRYLSTKSGRYRWDTLKLKLPLFGPLFNMFAMSRFARTMSLLLRSGLPILQVLDMTSKTVGNTVISQTINKIALSAREGKGVSEPMRLSGIFPPIVVQMVAVGEDTGKVDELLMKVSEYYDQQTDYAMKNLSTLIEPIFILILGVMVLIMALAIFLPMWNLIGLFKH
jgi:type II secretory pathway component PulF